MFFSYDPEGCGFQEHGTLSEAREACEQVLAELQGSASSDGWPEDDYMEQVVFGEIIGGIAVTEKKPWRDYLRDLGEDDEEFIAGSHEFEEYRDYGVREIPSCIADLLRKAMHWMDDQTMPLGSREYDERLEITRAIESELEGEQTDA